ncbi:Hpt domain-containing protein [Rhodopseudomonas palustris]|uniref:Hpt domain-containing protein n=1 Tax=Rhodopseudomonas palustris TaxID=1076 RepID=UPI002ACEA808|nr:Hpt domain-containing protein [Rhodopseudomonas palustris]WQG99794.1 Hpt domain-containing protein [Rhodopseudomonas palustris]
MASSQAQVAQDAEFTRRLAKIRARFISKLDDTIRSIDDASKSMSCDLKDSAAVVARAYRQIHDVCGIASTVGLIAAGLSARALDSLLVDPFRAQRGLTDDELTQLKDGLTALRSAALADISHETVQE